MYLEMYMFLKCENFRRVKDLDFFDDWQYNNHMEGSFLTSARSTKFNLNKVQ